MAQTELKVVAVDWKPEELANLVDNMIQTLGTLSWPNLLLRALAVYYVDGAERIASGAFKKSIELQMQSYSTRLIYSAIPFSFVCSFYLIYHRKVVQFVVALRTPRKVRNFPPKSEAVQKYSPAPLHGDYSKYSATTSGRAPLRSTVPRQLIQKLKEFSAYV